MNNIIPENIDAGIRPAVEILNQNGFETFESCEGGKGHCLTDPTVRFYGDEFDCVRAYEICQAYNLCVLEVKRVFRKIELYQKGTTPPMASTVNTWDRPFNEIVFCKHSETGTIFLPR